MGQGLQYFIIIAGICFVILIAMLYRIRRNREQNNSLSLNSNLLQLINQDQYEYYLIDVRSEAEYLKGHIPTAINVPYGQLSSFLPTDNLFTNMIVYGRSPNQSFRAATILSDTGYFNVTNFGPLFKWRGPVSRGDKEKESRQKSG